MPRRVASNWLLAAVGLIALSCFWSQGPGFAVAPPLLSQPLGSISTSPSGAIPFTQWSESGSTSVLPFAAIVALTAAASRMLSRPTPTQHNVRLVHTDASSQFTGVNLFQVAEEPRVIMNSAGGRRKRLGVGGKVCMLTGRKKVTGFYRAYSGKKIKRYWRPNTRWKKLWWDKEKKWVRLYLSCRAIRLVDYHGLDEMARRAGLDLYAWSKPHWDPASRQPLCLRVGWSGQAQKDRRYWPDYLPKLNKGQALAEIMPGRPTPGAPIPWKLRKLQKVGTPPKALLINVSGSEAGSDAI